MLIAAPMALPILLLATTAGASLRIVQPAPGATVLGPVALVEVRGCGDSGADIRVRLDGREVSPAWERGPYSMQWYAKIPLPATGSHALELVGRCSSFFNLFESSDAVRFTSAETGAGQVASRLAGHYMLKHSARRLAWGWGPAILLYGLEKLWPGLGYVRQYHAKWARKGIGDPSKSDDCPAALSALGLLRDVQDPVGMAQAGVVARYLREEPRNNLGALNHMGHSFWSNFFPDAIWVDSLMMAAVFAAQWGRTESEPALLEFGARQPVIYASVLQDPATGLLRHAWKTNAERPVPASRAFWLRGNAWVLVSIAEILDELPPGQPERPILIKVFGDVAAGLLPFQLPSGLWDTVANLPGYAYAETSGTALAAYSLAKGVRKGWLPGEYLAVAKRAFAGVTARIWEDEDGLSMPEISGATSPVSKLWYKLVPYGDDISYGVGAYVMAASELWRERF